jgi:hypothetical protein
MQAGLSGSTFPAKQTMLHRCHYPLGPLPTDNGEGSARVARAKDSRADMSGSFGAISGDAFDDFPHDVSTRTYRRKAGAALNLRKSDVKEATPTKIVVTIGYKSASLQQTRLQRFVLSPSMRKHGLITPRRL